MQLVITEMLYEAKPDATVGVGIAHLLAEVIMAMPACNSCKELLWQYWPGSGGHIVE
jgi:hypothetical protein